MAARIVRRVRHDVVKCTRRKPRRRVQQIADHDRGARLEPVEDHVVTGQTDEVSLHLESDQTRVRHSCRKGQHRSTGSATDIEHELMGFRRHRRGEEHRIDRSPVSAGGLPDADPAAEQPVLGIGGLASSELAHNTSSPAATKIEQARR